MNKDSKIYRKLKVRGLTANQRQWAMGRLQLIFNDRGVKINTDYYITDVLESTLKDWTFQQDLAPVHALKITQKWSSEN